MTMTDLGAGDIASAVTLSGAALLMLAAAAKLRAPQPTAQLLRQLNLPAPAAAVPAIAGLELASAGLAIYGGIAAIPMAAAYVLFTIVALRILRSAPDTSCGCFGSSETPVTAMHPLMTSVFAVAAAAATQTSPGWTLFTSHGAAGLLLALQVVLVCALAYAALAIYPQLIAARRKVAP
jgi:hypothetical protein